MSVFGVILVRIFPHSDWIRTRITPNTNTFYPVIFWWKASYLVKNLVFFHAITAKKPLHEKCPKMEFFLARIFPHSYSVSLRFQSECEKYGPEKTPYMDTFDAVKYAKKCSLPLKMRFVPGNFYLFKFNKENIKTVSEICSKLTVKTPKKCYWLYSDVLFVNFDLILYIVLMLLLLISRK